VIRLVYGQDQCCSDLFSLQLIEAHFHITEAEEKATNPSAAEVENLFSFTKLRSEMRDIKVSPSLLRMQTNEETGDKWKKVDDKWKKVDDKCKKVDNKWREKTLNDYWIEKKCAIATPP